MYRISRQPNFNVQDVLNIIIEHINTHEKYGRKKGKSEDEYTSTLVQRAERNSNLKEYLTQYENCYKQNGDRLYTIAGPDERLGDVLGIPIDDMKKLYKDFYSKSDSAFLNYRLRAKLTDLVKISCPICETPWGEVEDEIDHVLPKSLFPQYAITPINLICICRDCNSSKNDRIGPAETSGIINPYFNFINLTKYVECDVQINSNNIDFDITIKLKENNDLPDLDDSKYGRLEFFYEKCYKLHKRKGKAVRTRILQDILRMASEHRGLSIEEVQDFFKDIKEGINLEELQEKGQLSDEFLKFLLADKMSNMNYDIYYVFISLVEQLRNENIEEPEENF